MRIPPCAVVAAAAATLALVPAAALARPGDWGSPWDRGGSWDRGLLGGPDLAPSRAANRKDPREGHVDVSRFVAEGDAAQLLGHGPVTVRSEDGSATDQPVPGGALDYLPGKARAPFEAAVVDRLVAAGYDTMHADPSGGQIAELRVSREVLVPAEEKRNPVSGAAAMEVGNRGTGYGLALNVDMTKPRTALLSTRLDARIRDQASGKVLWEGRAAIATREGDAKWTDGMIASRLAEALFDDLRPAAAKPRQGPSA